MGNLTESRHEMTDDEGAEIERVKGALMRAIQDLEPEPAPQIVMNAINELVAQLILAFNDREHLQHSLEVFDFALRENLRIWEAEARGDYDG